MLLGLAGTAHVLTPSLPRDNRIRFRLPPDVEVGRVNVEVSDLLGETWTSAELFPEDPSSSEITYLVKLPPGNYRFKTEYEIRSKIRSADADDKNHGGGWTRVGVQHQIRLEGEDHHFPPPDHEAK